MVQDAEAHKGEDEKRKALVELKNQADALIAQTEKSMTEMGDKIEADEKAKIEAAGSADAAKKKDDDDVIDAEIE